MTTQNSNANSRKDPNPPQVNWERVRKTIDQDNGASAQSERDIARLDKSQPRHKGGRGRGE